MTAAAVAAARPRRWVLRRAWQVQAVLACIQALRFDAGQEWEVRVERAASTRSAEQNRLYWAIVGEVSAITGMARDDLHDWCKATFLGSRLVELAGKVYEAPASTAGLTVKQFSDYVTQVQAWAATEFGVTGQ